MRTLPLLRLARWCAGHPGPVLCAWLLFLAVAASEGLAATTGSSAAPAGSVLTVGCLLTALLLLLVLGSLRLAAIAFGYLATVGVGALGALMAVAERAGSFGSWNLVLLPGITSAANHLLFAVRRRQEMPPGKHDASDTAQIVASTAGRTALVTGLAMLSAMTGLCLTGEPHVMRLAAAVVLVVLVEAAAALTLLPVLLTRIALPVKRSFQWHWLPRFVARLPATWRYRNAAGLIGALACTAAALGYVVYRYLESPALPPLPLAMLIGLTSLAVITAFRPVVVALTTAVLSVLSALFALTMLTCMDPPTPTWLPVALVAVLAAPTTDMHVCLLHHFRVEALTGMSPQHVLAEGLRRGAVAISSASVVSIGIFSALGIAGPGELSEFGWAAAAALAMDVLVIRLVLLPLLLSLAGPVRWWRRTGPGAARK
ncbi:MMPL family transporter [Amycolatopsis rubida]|uniref:MMPL family transporter n=1 Tax=Amycolatopsis rubida TaxID=112413 RepID=A0ABX0BYH9_9PSEU|nr:MULTISPECIES: MMPL family transporter [Amycolatopsis]MYW92894.1 MMPL family transporter [Amycolatopsis rubida]NEC57881.1 MMPL family transporter [Amycolatopsis rubida]OAP21615.1 Membrane protein YdfJ [Amycolatopsis sp. M39]